MAAMSSSTVEPVPVPKLKASSSPPAPALGAAPTGAPALPTVTVVVISRLVFRKGVDLLINVIPRACARMPNVRFLIGGDGPKRVLLEEMRERHRLQHRVELLGAVPHQQVRDVLCCGQVFLNCSLTESFCIAVLEAACCGLFVVSTRVGGLPEVLPDRMIDFARELSAPALVAALERAVARVTRGEVDPWSFHRELRDSSCYSWPRVARRTALVYDKVAAAPRVSLAERYRRLYSAGPVLGPIAIVLATILFLYWAALEIICPACDVDLVPETGATDWGLIEELETDEAIADAHAAADAFAKRPAALGSGGGDEGVSAAAGAADGAYAELAVAAGSQVGFVPRASLPSQDVPEEELAPEVATTQFSFAVGAEASGSSAEDGAYSAHSPAGRFDRVERGGTAANGMSILGWAAATTAADGTIEATPRMHGARGPHSSRASSEPDDESADWR